jgi:hypothetical protein
METSTDEIIIAIKSTREPPRARISRMGDPLSPVWGRLVGGEFMWSTDVHAKLYRPNC